MPAAWLIVPSIDLPWGAGPACVRDAAAAARRARGTTRRGGAAAVRRGGGRGGRRPIMLED
jgi:hypothetical protein